MEVSDQPKDTLPEPTTVGCCEWFRWMLGCTNPETPLGRAVVTNSLRYPEGKGHRCWLLDVLCLSDKEVGCYSGKAANGTLTDCKVMGWICLICFIITLPNYFIYRGYENLSNPVTCEQKCAWDGCDYGIPTGLFGDAALNSSGVATGACPWYHSEDINPINDACKCTDDAFRAAHNLTYNETYDLYDIKCRRTCALPETYAYNNATYNITYDSGGPWSAWFLKGTFGNRNVCTPRLASPSSLPLVPGAVL